MWPNYKLGPDTKSWLTWSGCYDLISKRIFKNKVSMFWLGKNLSISSFQRCKKNFRRENLWRSSRFHSCPINSFYCPHQATRLGIAQMIIVVTLAMNRRGVLVGIVVTANVAITRQLNIVWRLSNVLQAVLAFHFNISTESLPQQIVKVPGLESKTKLVCCVYNKRVRTFWQLAANKESRSYTCRVWEQMSNVHMLRNSQAKQPQSRGRMRNKCCNCLTIMLVTAASLTGFASDDPTTIW